MEKIENEPVSTCLKCRAPLAEASKRGRPAVYCGVACRRAAEFEIRRIQVRLERLEGELEFCRRGRGMQLYHMQYGTPAERQQGVAEEIERAETRLRDLLVAGKE